MTDAELAEYWKFQAMHWKNLSNTYLQQILAAKNTPERHHGRSTLWADPTGQRAVHNVDKERKNRKEA